ncbi:MAG TPA: TIGR03000 domain-containing protein [Gemmataceae bacterium]|nr:TIGR03000 domain-containing protein [Gemmataceae bacterium]
MYSMVLMAALTTGTDMPDWGRGWGCCGCYGGYGWGGYGYGGYGRGGWGGGWGGWGGWGGGWGGLGYVYAPVAPVYAAPTALVANPLPTTSAVTRSMYYTPYSPAAVNRATIIVHVPDAATLTVDGKPTSSVTSTRRFTSPPLQPGKIYHYTFKARMERDGKVVETDERVEVRAGDRREITIPMPDLNQAPERQQTARPNGRNGISDRRRVGG